MYFGELAHTIRRMCDEAPLRCPVCGDHMVQPMQGVCLSVTIRGVASEVHGASVYHCANWHVFAVIAPRGSLGPPEMVTVSSVTNERG